MYDRTLLRFDHASWVVPWDVHWMGVVIKACQRGWWWCEQANNNINVAMRWAHSLPSEALSYSSHCSRYEWLTTTSKVCEIADRRLKDPFFSQRSNQSEHWHFWLSPWLSLSPMASRLSLNSLTSTLGSSLRSRKKFQFDVSFELLVLENCTFMTGLVFGKVHLLDGGNFTAFSDRWVLLVH